MRNTTKVWLFIVFGALTQLLIGYQFGGRLGLFIAFIFSLLTTTISYFFGDGALATHTKGRTLSGQDSWGLLALLSKFTEQLGLENVELQIVDSNSPICFALASPWSKNLIAISTAVLNRLSEREREALLANLCCKLHKNRNFLFSVTNLIANSILGVCNLLDRFFPKYQPFTAVFSPFCRLLVKLGNGHHTFFEIDGLTTTLVHDQKSLASVIWKLESLSLTQPPSIPSCSEHFFLVDPYGSKKNLSLHRVHPPVAKRIKKLVGYFPI